jgi:hypothetical protein
MRAFLSKSVRSPAVTLVTGLTVLVLGGCGEPEDLPSPGADGLVVMHWWDEKKPSPPAYLQAQRMAQLDAKFGALEFSDVMMRLPGRDGVVYVTAPYANYARPASTDKLPTTLAPTKPAASPNSAPLRDGIRMGAVPNQPIDGPVRFIGVWSDEVFIGRADQALFDENENRMRLNGVEFSASGNRHRTEWAALSQDQEPTFGPLASLPPAPAITAALAALPSPLVLPPIRR